MISVISAVTSGFGYVTAVLLIVPTGAGMIALYRICDRSRRFNPMLRAVCAALPAVFGVFARVKGVQNLPRETAPILLSNHVNLFDAFILRGYLPPSLTFCGMELESHFSWPVYGLLMRIFGNIPVPHGSPSTALHSIKRAVTVATIKNTGVLIFPEGHRTRTGTIQPFMSGPFRVARLSGMPVVPVVMDRAFQRKRVTHLRVTPGLVTIHIAPPIAPEAVAHTPLPRLKEELRQRMAALMR